MALTSSRKLKERPEEANGCLPVLCELIESSSEFTLQISPLAREALAVDGGKCRPLLREDPPNSKKVPFRFDVAQMPCVLDGRKASAGRRRAQRSLRQCC